MSALDEIATERARQIAKGYGADHDDKEKNGQIVVAVLACLSDRKPPWKDWTPPSEYRRRLIVAASLLVAEIERWDRAFPSPSVAARREIVREPETGAFRPVPKKEWLELRDSGAAVDWIEGAGYIVYDQQALDEMRRGFGREIR